MSYISAYKSIALMTAAAVAFIAVPASALDAQKGSLPMALSPKSVVGKKGDLVFKAQSLIVGVTSTATLVAGGDPRYLATPAKDGVVALIMEYANGDAYICSGSLIDRMTILTAGHCVSSGYGTEQPVNVTAYFRNSAADGLDPHFTQVSATRTVSKIMVNENYTGQVIDQNDIAALRLSTAAPSWAPAYALYDPTDLAGTDYDITGWGNRSSIGGSYGWTSGTPAGRMREGDNTYTTTWGDAAWGGFFTDRDPVTGYAFWDDNSGAFAAADYDDSWISDFDNGLAANDQHCLLGSDFGTLAFCDTGLGADEVSSAGGDSGGPQFVDGKIASVTSYGYSFGPGYGDVDVYLNNSFGEGNGFVPVYLHRDFIAAAMAVPEPATWGLMIAGFGMVGYAARRRKRGDMARVTA